MTHNPLEPCGDYLAEQALTMINPVIIHNDPPVVSTVIGFLQRKAR